MGDPSVRRWHEMMKTGGETGVQAALEIITALSKGTLPKVLTDPKLFRSIWQSHTTLGESGMWPQGRMHRRRRRFRTPFLS